MCVHVCVNVQARVINVSVHVCVSAQARESECSFQKSVHSFHCGSQGLKPGCQASAASACPVTSPAHVISAWDPWFCMQESLDTVSFPMCDVFQKM